MLDEAPKREDCHAICRGGNTDSSRPNSTRYAWWRLLPHLAALAGFELCIPASYLMADRELHHEATAVLFSVYTFKNQQYYMSDSQVNAIISRGYVKHVIRPFNVHNVGVLLKKNNLIDLSV